MRQFDVIIIGGGIIGATLACALGRDGVRVALLESREQPVIDTREREPRVYAISRASERIFTALSVWGALAETGHPFQKMHVWDAGGSGEIGFDCATIGEPCLGYILEPRRIQAALLECVQALPAVSLFCPARFSDIRVTDAQAEVALEDGTVLSGSLVVGADGARSPVREWFGIPVRKHDYHQNSLVAAVRTEHHHGDTAWQRFLPGGPLAFLPMDEGWSSIVWTLPETEIDAVLALERPDFHVALGEAFDHRLGDVVDSGPRESWPLRRLHAEHYVRERVALAGDAAHAIHPLAGQGVNLGLLDAAALAEVLLKAHGQGRDPGSLSVLRRYERWRRGDNLMMMSAMDAFNLLFSNTRSPLRWTRNLGLSMMNRANPAKDSLMRHAMGLAGDLPALARRQA
jgi:2-octaprenylphenol hydroxylase